MPPAFGPDNAGRQLFRIGIIRIRRQDTIDHPTPAIAPLAAAVLYAGVGEPKTLFGRATFMREFDEEVVHHPAMIQECDRTIRLNHPEQDGAGSAGRARAKSRRWTARIIGVQ
jgi:hypothetical protein